MKRHELFDVLILSIRDAQRDPSAWPDFELSWALFQFHYAKMMAALICPHDPLRRVDTVGGGGELFGTGSAGECDAGEDDADYEFTDAGSGDSGSTKGTISIKIG
jgi:hypothetical protein